MLFLSACITRWKKSSKRLCLQAKHIVVNLFIMPACCFPALGAWHLYRHFTEAFPLKPSQQPMPDMSDALYDYSSGPVAFAVRANAATIRHSGERRCTRDPNVWRIGCQRLRGGTTFPLVVLYHSRALKQLNHVSFTFLKESYATSSRKLADQDY